MIAQVNLGLVPTIATLFGIMSGIAAAIYAWRKAKPESAHVLVDAASDVVIIQKGYIDRQEVIIKNQDEAIKSLQDSLEKALSEIERLNDLLRDYETLREGYKRLKRRCDEKDK
jgi:hypothetical protein